MELNLKIYDDNDKSKVAKSYKAETFDMSFGVIEDTLEALDFENLDVSDKKAMAAAIFKGSRLLRPILKDIFPGITDSEIRNVKLSNLLEIFTELYKYATEELSANVEKKTKSGRREGRPNIV